MQKTEQTDPKRKKPYQKPQISSEKMFETTALACGKCTSGPFSQFACSGLPMNS